jgi:NAD(P)-dependent dehydrogenase (short-subunit alcohol dehydrogenase family)
MVEPGTLLSVANELAAGASDNRGRAVAAVLAAHGALEAFVNRVGREGIASFNYRARFLPKWHDLCERTL